MIRYLSEYILLVHVSGSQLCDFSFVYRLVVLSAQVRACVCDSKILDETFSNTSECCG
jgi:hypothetical protein